MKYQSYSCWFLLVVVLCMPILLSGQQNADLLSIKEAARSMSQGKFDQAQSLSVGESLEGTTGDYARELQKILAGYDQLHTELESSYQGAYQEYLDKIEESIQSSQWLQKLYETSQSIPFHSKEKEKLESDYQEKIDGHWLTALANLSLSDDLAKKTDVSKTIDPQRQNEIISRALDIAQRWQTQGKLQEAYGRIYRYLLYLDPKNEEYEKTAQQLLRQAILISMYVPDPNQDSVSWQERREGVSFDIVQTALNITAAKYVEEPNFKEMTQKALDCCRIIAETPQLAVTFEKIKDPNVVQSYLGKMDELIAQVKAAAPEQIGYFQVLQYLGYVIGINRDTLQLPLTVLMAEFTEGAYSTLDGYTYVIWPGDVTEFQKDMTNEFAGVGIVIKKKDNYPAVDSLLEDSPAQRAGLDAEDIITAVDGKSAANISLEAAVRRITGEAGTDVVLTINREGFDKPRDFTLTRDWIVVQTIKGLYRDEKGDWQYFVDKENGIAYVRMTNFSNETTTRFRNLLQQLQGENMRGLVLDLRNNSGGFLGTAVEIANSFLSSGTIVSTRSRNNEMTSEDKARPESTVDGSVPLVVLINGISASASEIVSGCLKDNQRALVIGTRSYGKGSVQTIQSIRPTQAQMKITIAYYYLPSGRRVNRNPLDKDNEDYGVEPDVTVELTGNQMIELEKKRRDAGILHQNGAEKDTTATRTVYNAEEIVKVDPQLHMALLCLKSHLLADSLGASNSSESLAKLKKSGMDRD